MFMKNAKLYLVSALISAALLNGCRDKEVVAPSVTNANAYPNGYIQNRFIYSVHVVSSSEAGARTSGLKEAQVTVSQNGKTSTTGVGENGMAIFEDLYQGAVTVYVSSAGHASWNSLDTLNVPIQKENNSNQVITTSRVRIITLPRLTGAVQGRLLIDNDKDPRTSPIAAGSLKVRLTYDPRIQPNVYFRETNAEGVFSFTNLPEADAVISTDSSFKLGSGDSLQYFNIKYSASQTTVRPLPRSGGSSVNLGTTVLVTGDPKLKFTGIITGKLFGDFAFVDKSRLKDGTNDVTSANAISNYGNLASITRFGTVDATKGVYTFIGAGGLTQSVADQFVDSLFLELSKTTNLDTMAAFNSVAYLAKNKSFVVSVIGLGNISRVGTFSATYLATDIMAKLTMTTKPAGYIGKEEFTTSVGADGSFTFSNLPLNATYEFTAEKYVTFEIPNTGTTKRFKFQLTGNSNYSVNGASFSNGGTPSGNKLTVTLGGTQTVPEDLGIYELKY